MIAGAGFRDAIFNKADVKGGVKYERVLLNILLQAALPFFVIIVRPLIFIADRSEMKYRYKDKNNKYKRVVITGTNDEALNGTPACTAPKPFHSSVSRPVSLAPRSSAYRHSAAAASAGKPTKRLAAVVGVP